MDSDGNTEISCKECGKSYWGPGKVFLIMHHLIQCGTNEKEKKKIIDNIVNLRLDVGSSCTISRFINIHTNADTKITDNASKMIASKLWEGTHQNSGYSEN